MLLAMRHMDAAPLAPLYSLVGCGSSFWSFLAPASYLHGIAFRSYRAFEHESYRASWARTRPRPFWFLPFTGP